jgi:hypothetical protein
LSINTDLMILNFANLFCAIWSYKGGHKPQINAGVKEIVEIYFFFPSAPLWHVIQSVRKVAVHLYKMLEVMSTSVYTGMNPFSFIPQHFPQICVREVAVQLYNRNVGSEVHERR